MRRFTAGVLNESLAVSSTREEFLDDGCARANQRHGARHSSIDRVVAGVDHQQGVLKGII
jgi:hypothetical protein